MAVEGRHVIQVPMINGMLGVHDGCAHARAFKHVPGNLSSLLKIHSFLHANAQRVLQCCVCWTRVMGAASDDVLELWVHWVSAAAARTCDNAKCRQAGKAGLATAAMY